MNLQEKNKIVLLAIILFLGGFFRLVNLDWDQGFHLHPDERFLTMVGNAIRMPLSFSDYLNPLNSSLNPANQSFPFYVYGLFPVTLNKIIALSSGNDNYYGFTIQGRLLSAVADLFVLLFLYKTVTLFEKRYHLPSNIPLLSAFFYAIAVLPIQLSHFFAVDTFLQVFLFASFFYAVRFWIGGSLLQIIFSSIAAGLALASKVSAVYMFPLIGFFIIAGLLEHNGIPLSNIKGQTKKLFSLHMSTSLLLGGLIFFLGIYSTVRLADPYFFASSNIFDPRISPTFIENIHSLQSWENVFFPPSVQWVKKPPVLFALWNIAIFGIGLPYTFLALAGVRYHIFKQRRLALIIITAWVFLFFLYQSLQFVKAMRYFFMLYPFLAFFAALGFYALFDKKKLYWRVLVFSLLLIWPLSYLSIYLHAHSRVQASTWIYETIPSGSAILYEYWDDALPLPLTNTNGKQYSTTELHVFDAESSEKWQKMNTQLREADYYILSSNRAWGSIPTVPEYYPETTKFYNALFAGERGYTKIKEFTSYPSLSYIGIPLTLPDEWADESFTVYDHPHVIIFKNNKK